MKNVEPGETRQVLEATADSAWGVGAYLDIMGWGARGREVEGVGVGCTSMSHVQEESLRLNMAQSSSLRRSGAVCSAAGLYSIVSLISQLFSIRLASHRIKVTGDNDTDPGAAWGRGKTRDGDGQGERNIWSLRPSGECHSVEKH